MTISIWWFGVVLVWAIVSTGLVLHQRWERKEVEKENTRLRTSPLTVQELATQKRVSVSTVARLAREGKIKAEKVGSQWRISQGENERANLFSFVV